MRILISMLAVVVTLAWCCLFAHAAASPPPPQSPPKPAAKTFCNPLNLDYGLIDHRGDKVHRHGRRSGHRPLPEQVLALQHVGSPRLSRFR
jgi:hypothetical protein